MNNTRLISRRGFLGRTATLTAAAAISPIFVSCRGNNTSNVPIADSNALIKPNGKPNSKFNGVQVGATTYCFRGLTSTDEIIESCVKANLSSVELRIVFEEELEGCPKKPEIPIVGRSMPGMASQSSFGGFPSVPGIAAPEAPKLTKEQELAMAKYEEDLAAFRRDPATLDKWGTIAKKYSDAGIDVHIFKWTAGDTDELLDYSFNVAKVFGAEAICTEAEDSAINILGKAAERNGMKACFHQHMQYSEMTLEQIQAWLDVSPAVMFNFDVGHYIGWGYENSTKLDPFEFIDHYSDRILSIHFKDKTSSKNQYEVNKNQVWGQGDTPVRELLQFIRDKHSHIYCDIELEYTIPQWSNAVKEVNNCVRFAREALI